MRWCSSYALVLLLGCAFTVSAQQPARPDAPLSDHYRLSTSPGVTTAAPGSFQVISVPIPEPFRQQPAVNFVVEPVGTVTVLSRRTGDISATGARSVLVTIGVPRTANAGTQLAARLIFAAGDESREIPLLIDVSAVRAVSLLVPDVLSSRPGGAVVELDMTATNRGNAEDTLQWRLELP